MAITTARPAVPTTDWRSVAQFGENVCGSLHSVEVMRRALPQIVRLVDGDTGAVRRFDERNRVAMATHMGSPVPMLLEFEQIAYGSNLYLSSAANSRFPVHDGMIHRRMHDHRRSPEGTLLARYGFEHCLYVLLTHEGRLVGNATIARQSGRPPFTVREQTISAHLSSFLSIALTNAVRHETVTPGPEPVRASDRLRRADDIETIRLDGSQSFSDFSGPSHSATRTLTNREREVLRLATEGLMNTEIGMTLGIATNTVKQHLKHAYRKLGLRSRLDALRYLNAVEG
jgi:DNA-binding CsgD family transcriptional regulator/GAF domain-containing protein